MDVVCRFILNWMELKFFFPFDTVSFIEESFPIRDKPMVSSISHVANEIKLRKRWEETQNFSVDIDLLN